MIAVMNQVSLHGFQCKDQCKYKAGLVLLGFKYVQFILVVNA